MRVFYGLAYLQARRLIQIVRRGVLSEALKQEMMMQSQLQDVYIRTCNRRYGTTDSDIEYIEGYDSSLHDRNAARYFERLVEETNPKKVLI